jgi:hypothetical protein
MALSGADCVAQLGSATCGDGLACVVLGGAGICAPYCNAANPCAQGTICATQTIDLPGNPNQPTIQVCESPSEVDASGFLDGGGGNPESGRSEGGLKDVPNLSDTILPR